MHVCVVVNVAVCLTGANVVVKQHESQPNRARAPPSLLPQTCIQHTAVYNEL